MLRTVLPLTIGVLIVGAVGYNYLPTSVQAGTITTCSQCGKQISSTVKTLSVPRYSTGNYFIRHVQSICPACQKKIDEENRRKAEEAERQEKIAKIRSIIQSAITLDGSPGVGINCLGGPIEPGPETFERRLAPGADVKLHITALNTSHQPIRDEIRFRLVGAKDCLTLNMPKSFVNCQGGEDVPKEFWSEWDKICGRGVTIGRPLNPQNDIYYKSDAFNWPECFLPMCGFYPLIVRKDIKPGCDYQITGFIKVGGVEVQMNTVTLHVMFP